MLYKSILVYAKYPNTYFAESCEKELIWSMHFQVSDRLINVPFLTWQDRNSQEVDNPADKYALSQLQEQNSTCQQQLKNPVL